MIRPDDSTPEQRRADLRADLEAESLAMTDAEIHDGLQKAVRILGADGHRDCVLAIIAAAAQVADLKQKNDPQSAHVKACIKADGGLYCLGWYLSYNAGDKDATLDGLFNADELATIAAHMRRTQQ